LCYWVYGGGSGLLFLVVWLFVRLLFVCFVWFGGGSFWMCFFLRWGFVWVVVVGYCAVIMCFSDVVWVIGLGVWQGID